MQMKESATLVMTLSRRLRHLPPDAERVREKRGNWERQINGGKGAHFQVNRCNADVYVVLSALTPAFLIYSIGLFAFSPSLLPLFFFLVFPLQWREGGREGQVYMGGIL